jgi:hypothetical protein
LKKEPFSPPNHNHGLFGILNLEQATLTKRYFVWMNNYFPSGRVYKFDVDIKKLEIELNKIPAFSDAKDFDQRVYREGRMKPILTEEATIFRFKDDFILGVFSSGSEIAFGKEIDLNEVEILSKIIAACRKKNIERKVHEFGMVVKNEYGNFDVNNFTVKKNKNNLKSFYNDDLVNLNPKIISFLKNKNANGLLMLHGGVGTGKTSYLRYLIQSTRVPFLYLPQEIFQNLSDPNFLPFIAERKGSVIILEDCEELLRPREFSSSASGISTLLNLSDGLLGDALKMKIICTFNADVRNIDPAVLRKGRLFHRYEFGPLSVEKTNSLLRDLKVDLQVSSRMTLAEIFNYHIENNAENEVDWKIRKVGF